MPVERSHEITLYALATHPEDNIRQQELTARMARGEIDRFSIEKRYVHPDGRVIWVVFNVQRVIDPVTGEVIPVVVPSTTTGVILKTLVDDYGVLPPELVETVTPPIR